MNRIKKHKSKNEYMITDDVWVRNFCKEKVAYLSLNKTTLEESHLFMSNEIENRKIISRNITIEDLRHNNVLIVSSGYNFEKMHLFLHKLKYKDVTVIAVNRALRDWKLIKDCKPEERRAVNFLLVNNPYKECMRSMPQNHKFFPPCIASTRTNNSFCEKYEGDILFYPPTTDTTYSGPPIKSNYYIDDYRNPICAALGIAWQFKAKKIMLLCCDDSFEDERPGSRKLENGLHCYPQQIMSQNIIEANLFWLKQAGVQLADYSSGIKYSNADYIKSEDEALSFFKDEDGILLSS